jgi:hypothetical protein
MKPSMSDSKQILLGCLLICATLIFWPELRGIVTRGSELLYIAATGNAVFHDEPAPARPVSAPDDGLLPGLGGPYGRLR